jgi:hypothetical protein
MPEENLKDFLAKHKATRKARADALAAVLQQGERRLLAPDRNRADWTYLVLPEPGPEGGWRCSSFDERGPYTHDTSESFETALRWADEEGADLSRAVEVSAATVDAVLSSLGISITVEGPMQDDAYLDHICEGREGPPPLTRDREDYARFIAHHG